MPKASIETITKPSARSDAQAGGQLHALIDSSTNVLLSISRNIAAIVFSLECIVDTNLVPAIQYPNYLHSEFLTSLKPRDYPKWTWKRETRTFVETRPDLATRDMQARSVLATEKIRTIARVMTVLNIVRHKVRTGVDFQETVYLTKRLHAQQFKDSGYDEKEILKFPYVLQYADYADISFRQAADDILLKAKMDDEFLAKTELLRLRYFKEVKLAGDPEQLPDIYERCRRECYVSKQI
jgi:hypothetical protein